LSNRKNWKKGNDPAYQRDYYQKHKEWFKIHPKKSHSKIDWRLRNEKKYGVRYPTWWLCDGCNKPISLFKKKNNRSEITLDHNHKTGQFRAWLCVNCNVALGRLDILENDKIERLLELVA
jgi:hypothetical protein